MSRTKFLRFFLLIGFLLFSFSGGFLFAKYFLFKDKVTEQTNESLHATKQVSIPDEIIKNRFGFLSGGLEGNEILLKAGAGWIRPHPGPFLWNSIQSKEQGEFSFDNVDRIVTDAQKENLAILATIWPFAEWDQLQRNDAITCRVPDTDEFLPEEFHKEGPPPGYISAHRCNPNNWEAYSEWIKKVVERYDGDGINDMPGLKMPIKYWEVLNEPDLNWNKNDFEEEKTLDFYMQEPEDYAELLIKTSQYIHSADPNAKILIAGAAGGSNQFMDFYKKVLQVQGVSQSFDIGNVHCISNDEYWNYNVSPYKKFFDEMNIDKPIWVTEAEAIVWPNEDQNASQTLQSTENALSLGAEKIFYTRDRFNSGFDKVPHTEDSESPNLTESIDGSDPVETFTEIFQRVSE